MSEPDQQALSPDQGDVKRVREAVETVVPLIAEDLRNSIAGLGYPVGMGIAPTPETCEKAARNIVARMTDKSLAALSALSSPPCGGEGWKRLGSALVSHAGGSYSWPPNGGAHAHDAEYVSLHGNDWHLPTIFAALQRPDMAGDGDAFARDLTDLCRRHGIALNGSVQTYLMDPEDHGFDYVMDDQSRVALGGPKIAQPLPGQGLEELRGALRDLIRAVTYNPRTEDFGGTPTDPNPCYVARVPVEFVTQALTALQGGGSGNG